MKAAARSWTAFAWPIALAPALFAWPQLREAVESRMSLHMLLQFPLLLASGWAASALLGNRLPLCRAFDRFDANGLLGGALLSCVSAFWMLPSALDLSLLSDGARVCKYTSWWLAGAAMCRSWPRLQSELVAFFGGNLSWMLATAGLLYQSSDVRLCVNYLIDDQIATGRGLVFASVMLGVVAVHRLVGDGEPVRAG